MIIGIYGKKILDKKNKKSKKIMKIYILGSKGMLGKYVYTYLSEKFNEFKSLLHEIQMSRSFGVL